MVSFSRGDAERFNWEAYAELMKSLLIVPTSVDHLVEMWRANSNMLDWAQKIKPDIYNAIRSAYADRRKQIEGGT